MSIFLKAKEKYKIMDDKQPGQKGYGAAMACFVIGIILTASLGVVAIVGIGAIIIYFIPPLALLVIAIIAVITGGYFLIKSASAPVD